MSYDAVRSHLLSCRKAAEKGGSDARALLDAVHQLTVALESDLTQIKGALSHIARLLEQADEREA